MKAHSLRTPMIIRLMIIVAWAITTLVSTAWAEDSESSMPEELDIQVDPIETDYMSVDEILNGRPTPAAKQKQAPPLEEFVELNEILYGTKDPQAIAEIKAKAAGKAKPDKRSLDLEMQAVKTRLLELNRDLSVLENDLLYPESTRLNIFVSFDAADYFKLDGVSLKLDDKPLAHHLYTAREFKALQRGAVQRLYNGNLAIGDHELVAIITGAGPKGRDFRRAVSLEFAKKTGTKYVELKILGDPNHQQAIFQLKEWD